MTMIQPRIECRRIDNLSLDDWSAVEAAFSGAAFAPLVQAWSETPSPDFRPGRAAAAWTDRSLVVFADLEDREIFNDLPAAEFNRLALDHGDVFEIFLQPEGQKSYYELHVSPVNQKFQLRIPYPGIFDELRAAAGFKGGADVTSEWVVESPVIDSRVRLFPEREHWQVVVEIPFNLVMENALHPAAGARWRFSFSRYDRDRDKKEPVYSSSSPHPEINYHRVQDWGVLVFVPQKVSLSATQACSLCAN
jgi:hypothetical protein